MPWPAQSQLDILHKKVTLRIITYNIFRALCNDADNNISRFVLDTPSIDIVCTQEDANLTGLTQAYRAMGECGEECEIVQTYVRKELADAHNATAICLNYCGKPPGFYTRNAILTSLSGATIASLHLEGGRFADTAIFTHFDELMKQKLGLLKKVIHEKPDIICGDFNSVYSTNEQRLQEFLEKQYTYFAKLRQGPLTSQEKNMIERMNLEPYELLKEEGYAYAAPSNDATMVTNGRGETTVDCFWYNPSRVVVTFCFIADKSGGAGWQMKTCTMSDHNPVLIDCEIQLKQHVKGGADFLS